MLVHFDEGLLSPLTVGHDSAVADSAVLDALVSAEVALARAYGALGAAPAADVAALSDAFGWQEVGCTGHSITVADLAADAVAGGNPVIPLVGRMRAVAPTQSGEWLHRGATSQDILDSALMLLMHRAATEILASLAETDAALTALAARHRATVTAARTLTQHAVPTTFGLRVANWILGIRRAYARLNAARSALPAQLGGAGGTLAAFVEHVGRDIAAELPGAFALELGLAPPDAPWHTTRWPVTEFGDALAQVVAALGVLGTDVATLSRTEIAEVTEGAGGGSSAMPQKRNPVASVLLRSAAMRAPHLAATLHVAAGLAHDERPDGAWHAEWSTLRELARVALGASAHAAGLAQGLRVDTDAIAANLALTGGLIVSERLAAALTPRIGPAGVADLVERLRRGEALPDEFAALLDPGEYTGLATMFVDDVTQTEKS